MSTTETPSPPPGGTSAGGPRVDGDAVRDLSRLRRTTKQSPEGRHLGGVAGGLARHLDVDPLVVRVALVVLVFFGGAGVVLYIGGWLLIPEEGGRAPIRIDPRSRAVLLWVVLGLAALAVIGDSVRGVHLPWPLIVVGVVVLWLVTRKNVSAPGPSDAEPAATETPTGAETTEAPPPSAGVENGDSLGHGADADTARRPAVPPAGTVTRPVRESDPRRTGPLLFWFTLALVALAEGILGTVDVAGAHIAAPAYPALALGIVGVMLVAGAFYGRAGGLILVGLVAAVALAAATAGNQLGPRRTVLEAPGSSAAVAPAYSMDTGRLTLDLSRVADVPGLAGRTVTLTGKVGEIEVRVPPGVGVDLRAEVHGPGGVRAYGDRRGGIGTEYDHVYAADPGQPTVTVVADLDVGVIVVGDFAGGRP